MSTDARPTNRPVLQVGPLKPSLAQTLQDDYAAYVLPDEPASARFLAEHGGEITAVVTSGRTGVDAELMAALPNLGAVVNFGVGYDTTDVDAAAARGVAVSNTPDVLTDCVADTAVGSDDRHAAPVLGVGPLRAGGPVAGRRQLSADAPGEQHAGRDHRTGPDRQRNRQAAQRFRMHDLVPQPA